MEYGKVNLSFIHPFIHFLFLLYIMMTSKDELKQEIIKYYDLGWNIIPTTITRRMLKDGRIEETKTPVLREIKPYFDANNRIPLAELLKHADTHTNPCFALVNGKQPNNRYYISLDIDTKDEQVRKLVLTNIPLSLYQETRKGFHIFLEIEGDHSKIRDMLENKVAEGILNGNKVRIEFRVKDCLTFFAGEGYSKLQGEMISLTLEEIHNAIRATLDAFNLCLILQDHYYSGNRNDTIYRLSGITAKKRIPKTVALMMVDALCTFYRDEQKAGRLQVVKNSYKAYENGEALNTKLEEIIPKDVAKKIYEYFDYRPAANGNGKKEKEEEKEENEKEKESLLFKLFNDHLSELEDNSRILDVNTMMEVMDYNIKKIPLQLYTLIGKNTHLHYADKLFESIYMDTVFTRYIRYDVNDKNFYYFVGNHYKRFDDEDTLLQLLYKYAVGYINKAMLRYYELKMREIELKKKMPEEGKLLQIYEQLQQGVSVEEISEKGKGKEEDVDKNKDEDEELRNIRRQLELLQEIFDCYMSYIFDRSRLKKVLDILKVYCSYSKNNDIHKDEYGYIIPFEDCYVYAKIDEGKPILKLIEPSPTYFIKFVFPVRIKGKFNPDYSNVNINFIKSTKLWRFMVDIANGDEVLAFTMLTIFGSCLMVHTKKRLFYILKGSGNNGKSTLIKLLEYTLEPIFGYIPVNALLVKDVRNAEETPRPFYLNMIDKRIGVTNELKEQGNLDSNIVKQTTGGDSIPVRNLFDRKVTYIEPNFTLFMTTNPMPKINDKSLAMRDRLAVIEFNRRFEGEEVDKYMLEKLLKDVEEIYLVLLEMLKVHLTRDVENVVKGCKAIMDTTRRYWYEQDGVQWYLDEYVIDTKDKKNDILYVNEIEDKIEIFYREIIKKDPPSRDTIRRLLRLKLPDDRFDYDIKKHRSLILRGYRLRPFATDDYNNNSKNEQKKKDGNGKSNDNDNDDDGHSNNNSNNIYSNNSNNSDNNNSSITDTTTTSQSPEAEQGEDAHKDGKEEDDNSNNNSSNNNNDNNNNDNDNNDNNDNDNDNDRETLDKILFALFNAENGGYLRCPICNDNVKYTSPYTFSKHVCYAHNREYGSFDTDVAGITVAIRIQDFIRLLQKFYPVTEEYDRFYYIRKLSEQMQKENSNGNRRKTLPCINDS